MAIEKQVENLNRTVQSVRNDHNKLVADTGEKIVTIHAALESYDEDSKAWREDRKVLFEKVTAIEAVFRGMLNLLAAHFTDDTKT